MSILNKFKYENYVPSSLCKRMMMLSSSNDHGDFLMDGSRW